jgi:hypothetical protein
MFCAFVPATFVSMAKTFIWIKSPGPAIFAWSVSLGCWRQAARSQK